MVGTTQNCNVYLKQYLLEYRMLPQNILEERNSHISSNNGSAGREGILYYTVFCSCTGSHVCVFCVEIVEGTGTVAKGPQRSSSYASPKLTKPPDEYP